MSVKRLSEREPGRSGECRPRPEFKERRPFSEPQRGKVRRQTLSSACARMFKVLRLTEVRSAKQVGSLCRTREIA